MQVSIIHFIRIVFTAMAFIVVSFPVLADSNTLLDSVPVKQASISTLPQWQRILKSDVSETNNSQDKNVTAWKDFTQSIQGQPKLRQMMRVNIWFEKFNYKQDNLVYNQDDYWTTPVEFLTKGGDCEDYAIIKYMTLRHLGFPAKAMKIAMVYDAYSGTDHSFLVVENDGVEYVLDTREKLVVERYMKNRYKPHYAFNEDNVWIYNSPTMVQTMRKDGSGTVLPGNR